MDREQILAFRARRHGLAERAAGGPADALACPASEVQPGSALLSIAARTAQVTREQYDRAVDSGEVAVGHSLRGALHATTREHAPLFGGALVADEPSELLDQLGEHAKRVLGECRIDAREALDEVARATEEALAARRALDKNELHAELRGRVREELLPWCDGCKSRHVLPMLWRYALVVLGARRDSSRRYVLGDQREPPPAAEAVRRFLGFYGPATVQDLEAWAGLARRHARRLWAEVEGELAAVAVEGEEAFLLRADREALASPPPTRGLRLLPPGDAFLQQPNRRLLAPQADVRKRAFRPVASPGVVLQDARLAGLWRASRRGKRLEVVVEPIEALDRDALQIEADLVALARGSDQAVLDVSS